MHVLDERVEHGLEVEPAHEHQRKLAPEGDEGLGDQLVAELGDGLLGLVA